MLGLRYNKKGIGPGAQTRRPGVDRPVRTLLSGRASPAALLHPSTWYSFPVTSLPARGPSGRRTD
jgi:hypothetical protein